MKNTTDRLAHYINVSDDGATPAMQCLVAAGLAALATLILPSVLTWMITQAPNLEGSSTSSAVVTVVTWALFGLTLLVLCASVGLGLRLLRARFALAVAHPEDVDAAYAAVIRELDAETAALEAQLVKTGGRAEVTHGEGTREMSVAGRPRIYPAANQPKGEFDHQVWLDPCSSAEDAAALWRAFGFEATPARIGRLLQMRHPEYLHHDNVTDQVRLVNVEEVRTALLPSGHFFTGDRTHDQTETHGD